MQRKNIGTMLCPVARTLERVGEWWSILILRDAFHGMSRFEQFQASLGIAPNILTRRLNGLVDAGLLERRLYSERPPRHEYLLTSQGRDFWPVLVTLVAYGNRHFADEGVASRLADVATGRPVEAVLVDRATGQPIDSEHYNLAAGPGADAALRMRIRFTEKKRANEDASKEWAAYLKLKEERKNKVAARKPKHASLGGRTRL
jgi:DNA-binding HxlR family transcriptional regulator